MKKSFLLFSLFSFLFALGITFGYSSEDTSNANYLADQQIIMKQTIASKYGLDNKILRQEAIGMALKVKGVTLPENYKCKKYFADATKNDWICRAVELAADNGIITKNNRYANPGKYVTRSEALAMMMKAGNIEVQKSIGISEGFGYYDKNGSMANDWQSDSMESARLLGIIQPTVKTIQKRMGPDIGIASYAQYYWRHNDLATRAEMFGFTKNVLNKPISSCSTAGEYAWYEDYSGENHLKSCCGGLTDWDSGMDTRISVGNTCYETGRMAGSLVYTCLACGDNICSDIETPCNCPQDCKNGENADYKTVAEFCESSSSENVDSKFEAYDLCH